VGSARGRCRRRAHRPHGCRRPRPARGRRRDRRGPRRRGHPPRVAHTGPGGSTLARHRVRGERADPRVGRTHPLRPDDRGVPHAGRSDRSRRPAVRHPGHRARGPRRRRHRDAVRRQRGPHRVRGGRGGLVGPHAGRRAARRTRGGPPGHPRHPGAAGPLPQPPAGRGLAELRALGRRRRRVRAADAG